MDSGLLPNHSGSCQASKTIITLLRFRHNFTFWWKFLKKDICLLPFCTTDRGVKELINRLTELSNGKMKLHNAFILLLTIALNYSSTGINLAFCDTSVWTMTGLALQNFLAFLSTMHLETKSAHSPTSRHNGSSSYASERLRENTAPNRCRWLPGSQPGIKMGLLNCLKC